jgi:Transmembrane protein 43
VTFKVLKPAAFSVIAQQTGNTFAPYQTRAGNEIERVESAEVTAGAMFQHAASENAMLTWGLRAAGFVVMSIGIGLILRPISVFADVIPFVGNIIGAGVALAAMVLGMAITLVTIAVVWIVVRPIVGGALLVLAIAGLIFGHQLGARRKASAALAR